MRRFEKGGKARAESSRRSRTSLQASEQASFDGMRLSGDKCDDAEPEPGAKTNEGLGLGSRAPRQVSLNFLRLCFDEPEKLFELHRVKIRSKHGQEKQAG